MAPMMIQLNNAIKQVTGFDLTDLNDAAKRMDYEQLNKLK